ncbi:rhodanese-like domain-containing protein [Nocardioides sp.]|uniref:rhodanese-like domain-containing protein n=1 Tax=Nocardioides sp. TaxID=35761 RepID=UPI003D0C29B6
MSATTFEQLFLDSPRPIVESRTVSARAAYQAVLGEDAVLVDLRAARLRRDQGEVHPDLEPVVLSPAELAGISGRVLLLCADGQLAARAAEALRRLGHVGASAVTGGYAAWRAAGMPTT